MEIYHRKFIIENFKEIYHRKFEGNGLLRILWKFMTENLIEIYYKNLTEIYYRKFDGN
jgi:hypothetical protein